MERGLIIRNWIQCLFYGAILFSALLIAQTHTNPILFVTQLPIPDEWMTISQTFGNHLGSPDKAGRGGDLWIRYPDGTLRNLTEAAGYGNSGFQGSGSIAVRDPHVHWDGNKAIFSMVIGAAEQQYVYNDYFWQLYEISGLGINDTLQISKVPNQPENFNNINPAYGSDERIIFASDRPRNGATHLYPQLDEYESAPTVTGLWSLDPANGNLFILNHSPSGSFRPFVDSYGRIIYTRWDHLQRDQQNDAGTYGTYNWSGEDINAVQTTANTEYFTESRYANGNLNGHTFELFFPGKSTKMAPKKKSLIISGVMNYPVSFRDLLQMIPILRISTSRRLTPIGFKICSRFPRILHNPVSIMASIHQHFIITPPAE